MVTTRRTGLALTASRVLVHVLLIAGALVMLYPLFWMVAASFREQNQIFNETGLLPINPNFDNYVHGWTALSHDFTRYFLNSFVISTLAVIGNVFTCAMAAYAFARLRWRGRPVWFAIMLLTLMLPGQVLIIPQYVVFHNLGWIDTFYPLTVPHFLATDAFFVFLMVQFIRGLPPELDDAARIDGCSHVQIFTRITLPLMKPALVTTAIFTFIFTWDNFFAHLIILNSRGNFTVPLALRQFLDTEAGSSWGAMFAMSVLALIPVLVIFLVLQKRLTQGIATTGLKA